METYAITMQNFLHEIYFYPENQEFENNITEHDDNDEINNDVGILDTRNYNEEEIQGFTQTSP